MKWIPEQVEALRFRRMGRRFRTRYRRAVGPLEATALLNVALLGGMMAWLAKTDFLLQPGIRVELPEAEFEEGTPYGARTVAVTREGLYFHGDQRVERADLGAALARGEDGEGVSGPLLIEADAETPYGTVVELFGLATKAGWRDVVLATRPPAAGRGGGGGGGGAGAVGR